jgi:hypothetical protein
VREVEIVDEGGAVILAREDEGEGSGWGGKKEIEEGEREEEEEEEDVEEDEGEEVGDEEVGGGEGGMVDDGRTIGLSGTLFSVSSSCSSRVRL